MFGSLGWPLLFVCALAIYFYAHYGFASITAHVLAMYPPFLAILLAKQAPVGLIVFAFACFANLSAGLTNYGTTPAPMFFAQEYVPLRDWWRIGLIISLLNIAIWSTIGFGWWKLLGSGKVTAMRSVLFLLTATACSPPRRRRRLGKNIRAIRFQTA